MMSDFADGQTAAHPTQEPAVVTRLRRKVTSLANRLETIREEERQRLARRIQNDLGQDLAVLNIDLCWLKSQLRATDRLLLSRAESMSFLLHNVIHKVRMIGVDFEPLDQLEFGPAVQKQVREFTKKTEIQCELTLDLPDDKSSPEVSGALYSFLREALTNVARHSGATRVTISLTRKNDQIDLLIQDNGRGITWAQSTHRDSLGIIGMRETIQALNGEFSIEGIPDGGTTLRARIPLTE